MERTVNQLYKEKIIRNAKKVGLELTIREDVDLIDKRSSVWYGDKNGPVASIADSDGWRIDIYAAGEVNAVGELPDGSDFWYSEKTGAGALLADDSSFREAFHSDREFRIAMDMELFEFLSGNWYEYFIVDGQGVEHEGDVIGEELDEALENAWAWVDVFTGAKQDLSN